MKCNSKTYCPYPFIGASLQPDNTVLPCGQYMNMTPFNEIKSIEEVRNNDHMKLMRQKMLQNETDSGCQCHAEETAGVSSMRLDAINQYGYQEFGKLKVIEIFFNNICNLKCRSCASPYSHLWFEDEKELYGKPISDKKYTKNKLYNDLDISNIETIKIYGGEPLFGTEANDFFKKINDQNKINNLKIDISTNGTVLPKSDIEYSFLNCKYLGLNISVDAYGNLNNFIRSGSIFENIVDNMKFYNDLYKKRPNGATRIKVHSAVSVYNVNQLSILTEFITKNFPNFEVGYQLVQFPLFLSIKNLPETYKNLLRTTLTDKIILEYLNLDGENYFPHFINFHNKLNKIRKEKFNGLNPLLEEFIFSYNNETDFSTSQVFFNKIIKELKG